MLEPDHEPLMLESLAELLLELTLADDPLDPELCEDELDELVPELDEALAEEVRLLDSELEEDSSGVVSTMHAK